MVKFYSVAKVVYDKFMMKWKDSYVGTALCLKYGVTFDNSPLPSETYYVVAVDSNENFIKASGNLTNNPDNYISDVYNIFNYGEDSELGMNEMRYEYDLSDGAITRLRNHAEQVVRMFDYHA